MDDSMNSRLRLWCAVLLLLVCFRLSGETIDIYYQGNPLGPGNTWISVNLVSLVLD